MKPASVVRASLRAVQLVPAIPKNVGSGRQRQHVVVTNEAAPFVTSTGRPLRSPSSGVSWGAPTRTVKRLHLSPRNVPNASAMLRLSSGISASNRSPRTETIVARRNGIAPSSKQNGSGYLYGSKRDASRCASLTSKMRLGKRTDNSLRRGEGSGGG